MSRTTPPRTLLSGNGRWLLPLILALIIAGIILGTYFATHNSSKSASKASPTTIPSPTVTVIPTGTAPTTPQSTPTSTPRPRPTATPGQATASAPTPTPKPTVTPGPTSAASGLKLGTFSYKPSILHAVQQHADANDPAYTYYLDPFKVVMKQLPQDFGFTSGPVTIVSPPAQPTPTPYSNAQSLPETKITVQYQGKRYTVVLDQPETQGPTGIWIIYKITVA
jgi:hypothetical protein